MSCFEKVNSEWKNVPKQSRKTDNKCRASFKMCVVSKNVLGSDYVSLKYSDSV